MCQYGLEIKKYYLYLKDVRAKNFYNYMYTDFFNSLATQSDNELPMSQMQKNLGGHRLRLRNKARGKLPQF